MPGEIVTHGWSGMKYYCYGEMLTKKEIERRYELSQTTLNKGLARGMKVEDIIAASRNRKSKRERVFKD